MYFIRVSKASDKYKLAEYLESKEYTTHQFKVYCDLNRLFTVDPDLKVFMEVDYTTYIFKYFIDSKSLTKSKNIIEILEAILLDYMLNE